MVDYFSNFNQINQINLQTNDFDNVCSFYKQQFQDMTRERFNKIIDDLKKINDEINNSQKSIKKLIEKRCFDLNFFLI